MEGHPSPPYELLPEERVEGVTVVRDIKGARRAIEALYAHKDNFFAVDTEVADLNLKTEGPVGNGRVICFSVYGGPDVDFGHGKGTTLWVDNMGVSEGVLSEFKEWFKDPATKKVWHNYGFDRHVLYNEGVDCLGFAGDTMHMARLWDSSRDKASVVNTKGAAAGAAAAAASGAEGVIIATKGYSLEALSKELVPGMAKTASMKELFGVKSTRKDGSEGNLVRIPELREIQADPAIRLRWIGYSALDALSTWALREELEKLLKSVHWEREPLDAVGEKDDATMYDFYRQYFVPFGTVLTDMERMGIRVDAKDYLASIQVQAEKDKEAALERFLAWASKYDLSMRYSNPGSSAQMQTFLFGGTKDNKGEDIPRSRTFKIEIPERYRPEVEAMLYKEEQEASGLPPSLPSSSSTSSSTSSSLPPSPPAVPVFPLLTMEEIEGKKVAELKVLCKERGLKVSGKKAELIERLQVVIDEQAAASTSSAASDTFERDDLLLRLSLLEGHDPLSYSLDGVDAASEQDLRDMCATRGLLTAGTEGELRNRYKADVLYTAELKARRLEQQGLLPPSPHSAANPPPVAVPEVHPVPEEEEKKKKERKWMNLTIHGLGLTPEKFTTGGGPQVSGAVLRKLAGSPSEGQWGSAYAHFNGGKEGEEACIAIDALCSMGSIDTMLSNFLLPLQELADDKSRVHCSLNLNTETGRLSARRPNLQNQPALEKDQYKIRKAFVSEPNKSLIVADYGQLELRLLAHITKCQSMINAFKEGGCFHSRTAVGMFDHVRKAVDDGEVLLEWDYSQGQPPAPLLKDKYGSERRKAKTLNFSIAYGKTAYGLSKDWGVTTKEAEEMLLAWYADRPEVKEWQDKAIADAHKTMRTKTLMGRYRKLPEINSRRRDLRGHAERAAINTPIQGGAADVVMMAMLRIHSSEVLARLGWKLLLQIHDEVIVEGPDESKEEALAEVKRCMEHPNDNFGLGELMVKLEVDAKIAKSWYEAK